MNMPVLPVLHFNAAFECWGPRTLPHTLLPPPLFSLLISQGHTALDAYHALHGVVISEINRLQLSALHDTCSQAIRTCLHLLPAGSLTYLLQVQIPLSCKR